MRSVIGTFQHSITNAIIELQTLQVFACILSLCSCLQSGGDNIGFEFSGTVVSPTAVI